MKVVKIGWILFKAGILQNDMTLRSDIYLGGQTLLGHTKEMLCGDFQIIQLFRDTNLLKIMNSLLWTQLFEFNIKWKFERNENFWGQYIWTLFWKKFVQLQNKLVIFAFPSSPSHYHFTILKCKKGPSLILPSSIASERDLPAP